MSWYEFENGSTIGELGTEGGEIVKDEEFDNSARITLEKLSEGHFAVTCGDYATFFHTTWFDEANALSKYEQMKLDLEEILDQENEDDYFRLIKEFVHKY